MSERSESNGCSGVTLFGNSHFRGFWGGVGAAVNWLIGMGK
jgi:hypothetical protein